LRRTPDEVVGVLMNNIRAVEHIGVTVPDLEQATTFFAEAFGAQKIYDMLDEPLRGPAVEKGLGVPEGAVIEAIRMLRLGHGPNIELFTYTGVPQRDAVVPSDYGLQHFCVYVDDIAAAAAQVEMAGGTLLSTPGDLPGGDV
jgi:catechol 2,3-dioxygenase-like lactoylglutathione lyase family enzyme